VPEDVQAIVDEVREAQLRGVSPLVLAAAAEADLLRRKAGALEEAVVLEPAPGERLDAGARLRDQPGAPAEAPYQAGDHLEHVGRGRRLQGRRLAGPEEAGVGPPVVARGAHDDAADVDAQSGGGPEVREVLSQILVCHAREAARPSYSPELLVLY